MAGAGLGLGAGWEGAVGAGKISQIPAGAGLNFAGVGLEQTKMSCAGLYQTRSHNTLLT